MNILFVCTGNACRSAAAEAVLRKQLRDARVDNVTVASAGTLEWGSNPRDAVMIRIAASYGYVMEGSTQCMTQEMLNAADLILVMTSTHRDEVTRLLDYSIGHVYISSWSTVSAKMPHLSTPAITPKSSTGKCSVL